MRKGSFVLGSLGSIPSGIKRLMLPLAVAVIPATLIPAAACSPARRQCSRYPGWWQRAAAAPKPGTTPKAAAAQEAVAAVQEPVAAPTKPVAAQAKCAAPAQRSVKSADLTPSEIAKVIHTRATWYGPGFHGRRTASGEVFNRNAMTLASRHLPFGTVVRVVNPRTGKACVARVNDRGPFRSGYTADLSQGLARRIGMLSSGPVRLEILKRKK